MVNGGLNECKGLRCVESRRYVVGLEIKRVAGSGGKKGKKLERRSWKELAFRPRTDHM